MIFDRLNSSYEHLKSSFAPYIIKGCADEPWRWIHFYGDDGVLFHAEHPHLVYKLIGPFERKYKTSFMTYSPFRIVYNFTLGIGGAYEGAIGWKDYA